MNKWLGIWVCSLFFIQGVMAQEFSTSLSLGKHKTNNPYGVWSLEKKRANTKQLRSKILPKEEYDIYPCLEYVGSKGICWEIRILDVATFKKEFVGKDYYHFYWEILLSINSFPYPKSQLLVVHLQEKIPELLTYSAI